MLAKIFFLIANYFPLVGLALVDFWLWLSLLISDLLLINRPVNSLRSYVLKKFLPLSKNNLTIDANIQLVYYVCTYFLKGSFTNYVDKIFPIIEDLSTPCWHLWTNSFAEIWQTLHTVDMPPTLRVKVVEGLTLIFR